MAGSFHLLRKLRKACAIKLSDEFRHRTINRSLGTEDAHRDPGWLSALLLTRPLGGDARLSGAYSHDMLFQLESAFEFLGGIYEVLHIRSLALC